MTALNKACPCFTVMIRTPCSRGIWYLSSSWLLSEGPCLLSSDQLLCRSSVGFSRAMFFHISLPGLKLIDQSINHFITSEIQSKWSLELALLAFSLVLVSCPILPKLRWILCASQKRPVLQCLIFTWRKRSSLFKMCCTCVTFRQCNGCPEGENSEYGMSSESRSFGTSKILTQVHSNNNSESQVHQIGWDQLMFSHRLWAM